MDVRKKKITSLPELTPEQSSVGETDYKGLQIAPCAQEGMRGSEWSLENGVQEG